MHTSIVSLQTELERAKDKLKVVEESIKKNIGRDINQPPNNQGFRAGFKRNSRHLDDGENDEGGGGGGLGVVSGGLGMKEGGRGMKPGFVNDQNNKRFGPRNNLNVGKGPQGGEQWNDFRQQRNNRHFNNIRGRLEDKKPEERVPVKRRLGDQAITVFSRLSGPPKDEEFEEETNTNNFKMSSQVIVQDAPSRKDVLAAQSGDNQCKERNKRMFGALLGTLQKFRQEENKLKEKEDKRAQVEKKLEEAAEREKEEAKRTRQQLFSSRRNQQIQIRQLEFKLLRLKQLTEWEATKVHLTNFIQTKTQPRIFFLPKVHNARSQELLAATRDSINKMIADKRAEVEKAIEEHVPDLSRVQGGIKTEPGDRAPNSTGQHHEEEEEESLDQMVCENEPLLGEASDQEADEGDMTMTEPSSQVSEPPVETQNVPQGDSEPKVEEVSDKENHSKSIHTESYYEDDERPPGTD